MKKIILKEFDRTIIVIDIMLYVVIAFMGNMIVNIPEIENMSVMEYTPSIFFMFGFFGILAYFLNRREGNYEFLLFGLTNVVVGTFVFVNRFYPDSSFILGNSLFIYSLFNILNKGYHTRKLMMNRDINCYVKLSVTILLFLLGLYVAINLYCGNTIEYLVMGYYFLVYGLVSLLEPFLFIIIKNPSIEVYLASSLKTNKKIKSNNKKIDLPKVKKITPKKIKIEKTK